MSRTSSTQVTAVAPPRNTPCIDNYRHVISMVLMPAWEDRLSRICHKCGKSV